MTIGKRVAWLDILKKYNKTIANRSGSFPAVVQNNFLYFPDPNAKGLYSDHYILCYPSLFEIQGVFGYCIEPPFSSPTLMTPFMCALTKRDDRTFIGIETKMIHQNPFHFNEKFGMKLLHKKTKSGNKITYLPIWISPNCELITTNQLDNLSSNDKMDDESYFKIQVRGTIKDEVGKSYYSICKAISAFEYSLQEDQKTTFKDKIKEEYPVLLGDTGAFSSNVDEKIVELTKYYKKKSSSEQNNNSNIKSKIQYKPVTF